jgi:hypothetical protein
MTPREFWEALKGYRWRWRQSQELVLSAAVLVLSPCVKDPPTVQELLGETSEQRFDSVLGDPMSKAEALEAALAKQKALRAD